MCKQPTMTRSTNLFNRNHPNTLLLINLQTTKTLFLIKKKKSTGATGGFYIKKRFQHMFFCEYWEICKNTCFEEHVPTASSEVTLRSDCLGLSFWRVAFKTRLRNITKIPATFKPGLSLNLTLTLYFESRFPMITISGYDRKSQRV